MNRRNWLYLGAAGLGLGGGLAYQFWQAEPQDAKDSPTGSASTAPGTAPTTETLGSNGEGFFDGSFPKPDGAPLAMASFRGKPLLVNFWGTWCPPCIEELPLIDAFFQQNQSKGWQTLGLAVDQAPAVQKFLSTKPLSFPIAMAGLSGIEMTRKLGNLSGALPFSVMFNAKGELVQRKLGKLSEADLRAWAGV
jgi:thiol-disulfide isomerase/thioredoxin